ncbi:hypothetical protein [Planococcus beigongshangi]|uniref:hypothetical protein n=1 Tax=Planococcus beigongshangi TaxID=2782536 RepID=UPI00193B8F9B|nr:hypothetical protein [Planococcus beigongshangi]
MVKEEEKVVFVYELDKLRHEYRKCTNLSMRQQIREDISLLQTVIGIAEEHPSNYREK